MLKSEIKYALLIFFLLFLNCSTKHNTNPDQNYAINASESSVYKKGMVSTANKYATFAGLNILKKGGNAIDAAVAIGFVLAVTYPQAGNIGGGGFMLIRTKDNKITSIDYREKAPLKASRNMFLDETGNFIPEKSQVGHLSAGVPGTVAGLLYALDKYGTLKREDIIQPAVDYAEFGFEIDEPFANSLNNNKNQFNQFSSTKKTFTKNNGSFKTGDSFKQPYLANTLKLIQKNGRDGFYKGYVAELIENEMKLNGGIITKYDLEKYEPVERYPLHTNYKGFEIYSMAPPSSGGIALINLLNIIEGDDIPDTNNINQLSDYYSLLVESMKRVYADRSEYLGDPDFYEVPVQILTGKDYARKRRKEIGNSVIPSNLIKPGSIAVTEGENTTHYSVIDNDGNMVSVTTTLNNTYGSFVVVDGAGFLLNDEMDDFASKPGEPNMFGLTGNDANSIEPGKRMLSSMTPTIVLKKNEPFLILGSPGGGKIITTVFQTIINIIDFNFPLDYAIDKPRFHHQWMPDKLQTENNALTGEIKNILKLKGYTIETINDFGRVEGILIDWKNKFYLGHSDRRGNGLALGY